MSHWNGVGKITTIFSETELKDLAPEKLAPFIDHTLLKPDATKSEITKLCQEAAENSFMSVCINPFWIPTAATELKNSDVKVCTVIGFPLGANDSVIKAQETKKAIEDGADEVDMVINIGALLSGDIDIFTRDISAVVEIAKKQNILSKVILETAFLSDDLISKACEICVQQGADFVKTSTGFAKGGATEHHIALMRQTVGDKAGVKASGGVRDYKTALAMLNAGATRIGASSSLQIIGKSNGSSGGY